VPADKAKKTTERPSAVPELIGVAERLLEEAKKAGATSADAMAARTTDFEVKVADGAIVTLTQATSKGIGLRVLVGGRMGLCTTSDFHKDSLAFAARRAVQMAREAADDPHNALAEAEPGHQKGIDLDLYDPAVAEVPADTKIAWAHELERAARSVDKRVKKFRDSGVSSGDRDSVLVTSSGVIRSTRGSGISIWCNPLAESDDGELQTEFWYDSQTHLEDLEPVEKVGRIAGERAVRMLGAKPVKTQEVPVIFEPMMAAGLVGGIIGAINGDMIYKKASFLLGKLGEPIATPRLTVMDDPHLLRGAGSAAFDGEGLPTYKKALIDKGVLTTYLYDTYTARKAGQKPTASGRRSMGGLPHASVYNFYVEAGTDALRDILRSSDKALLVTRGLGSGVNSITGEYSRGMNGLWIEKGEIVHPVQEVTVAGDFVTMMKNIDRIGSDFMMRGGSGAPTLRIASMMVSGA
jgi:PmbA protein